MMEVIGQSLFFQNVCTDLVPEYIDSNTKSQVTVSFDDLGSEPLYTSDFVRKFNESLREHGFAESGTRLGWVLHQECPACPCEENPGHYHYLCCC